MDNLRSATLRWKRRYDSKNNNRMAILSQESSEIDLSIPSSVEEDIFRRRIERDIESLQQRCPISETEATENATMNLSCERRLRNPTAQANEANISRRHAASEIHHEAACGEDSSRRPGKCQLNRTLTASPRKPR